MKDLEVFGLRKAPFICIAIGAKNETKDWLNRHFSEICKMAIAWTEGPQT